MKYKSIFLRLLAFACVIDLLVKVRRSMAKRLTFTVMLSAVIISGTLSSCQYKDFDDYDGTVSTMVVMDWSGLGRSSVKPEVMKVVFYPINGSMHPFPVNVKDSAMVYLPLGQYRIFAYNDDSSILRISGTDSSFGTPVVYTDKADNRGLPGNIGTFYDYPNVTYATYTGAAVMNFTDNRIILKPEVVTRDVEVIVDSVLNQKDISSVRMSLDGVSNTYTPLTAPKNFVTMVSDAGLSPSENRITSSFHVYGLDRSVHTLQLFITGNGFKRILSFDVTGLVNDQIGSGGKVIIHVTAGYDAEKDVPVDATSGIGVGVDDWPSEDIPLNL